MGYTIYQNLPTGAGFLPFTVSLVYSPNGWFEPRPLGDMGRQMFRPEMSSVQNQQRRPF